MALKPLEDALRDGDTIRAVVRGTGTNQDGNVRPQANVCAKLTLLQEGHRVSQCLTWMRKHQ